MKGEQRDRKGEKFKRKEERNKERRKSENNIQIQKKGRETDGEKR